MRIPACSLLPAAVFGLLGSAVARGEEAPPNVVVICVDTLRADHTSIGGYVHDTTPVLARLAAEGVSFSNAYAPVSATAPTHATLFTGLHPLRHGLLKNGLDLRMGLTTLAEILGERGYQTAAVVSSFVLDRRFGFEQGFSYYDDAFEAESATVTVQEWEGHTVDKAFDRTADRTTYRAIRWLWLERDPKRPFFLFLHYFDPHSPYVPPEAYRDRFPVEVPEEFRDPHSAQTYRDAVGNYDGEIAFADAEIGRALAAFESQGLLDDTLVVVTADHGEGLMAHGGWSHGFDVYEESVRVPLVVRWPGRVTAGLRLEVPVSVEDVLPTILDLLGRRQPEAELDGISLAAMLQGGKRPEPARPLFFFRRHFEPTKIDEVRVAGEQHAVRLGPLKLIRHSSGGRHELYDLDRDPGERKNLFSVRAEDARRLSATLDAWKQRLPERTGTPTLDAEARRALEALGYVDP